LVRGGKVFAVGTEDMDALTFGTNILLRHLTFSEARKMPIKEFHLSKVLEGLDLTMDQFVDLCILLGCDYCEKIRGVGPKSAYKLIQEHKSIEGILAKVDKKKHTPPDDWLFAEARRLFKEPEVTPANEVELKWEKPDEEALVKYMCEQKGFSEDRIRAGAKKLAKARQGSTQGRLDGFFKVLPSTPNQGSAKRKSSEDLKKSANGKKAKTGGGNGKWRR
jgi:flap endonuclease-1